MTEFDGELDRAREAYAERDRTSVRRDRYDPLVPGALFRLQEREWTFAEQFRRAGLRSLAGLDLLEVGCGGGASLARFIGLGAEPEHLTGIDLVPERIEWAKRLLPQADLRVGSAHELPFPDERFDIVAQMTLFSSVLDPALRAAIAAEMLRILRPGGLILWYDAHRSASSPAFVPISAGELGSLFPGCEIDRRSVTLRWGLIYRLVARSRSLGIIAQWFPGACSHYAAVIRPRSTRAVPAAGRVPR